MQLISFYIVYGLIWLLARLPVRILYFLSDIVFFFIYYVFPYRRKLVFKNLRNSFPGWDDKKIQKTAKHFYRYLCDFFLESTVLVFRSEKEVMKHQHYKNPELLDELYSLGKSVILVFGHYGNWEYLSTLQKYIHHKTIGVYKPLHNKYIDRMFIRSRQRYGLEAVPIDRIIRSLSDYKNNEILNISFFAADQRPLMKNIKYWTTFLNQDTPVVIGPEKISKKLGSAVVYLKVSLVKRGYYENEFILICDNPETTAENEITNTFLRILENQIKEEPSYWLWTHDRWKHSKVYFDTIFRNKKQG